MEWLVLEQMVRAHYCICIGLKSADPEIETFNELGDDVHFSNISVFSNIDQYALSSMTLMSLS